MISIRVPATSANLGSGFDELGLALQLYATFKVSFSNQYELIGFEDRFLDNNLFIQSYETVCKKEGFELKPLRVEIHSDIPISRGLGSSSSLIVGGVAAAFALHRNTCPRDTLLSYATEIEGHPDNVAPAIYGGLIQANPSGIKSLALHPSLRFSFLIPDFELSTSLSRSVLPKEITPEVLALSQTKCAALIEGLKTARFDLLNEGCDDVRHQPYRFPLIADFPLLKTQLETQGLHSYFLSGAGPTLGLIHTQAIHLDFSVCQAQWILVECPVDTKGVEVSHG